MKYLLCFLGPPTDLKLSAYRVVMLDYLRLLERVGQNGIACLDPLDVLASNIDWMNIPDVPIFSYKFFVIYVFEDPVVYILFPY